MIIILEGMSAVGKTTIQKELANILQKKHIKYRLVNEKEILPPDTFANPDPPKSIAFLTNFLHSCNDKNEVIICDRLHLSHIAITNASDKEMVKIEQELLKCDPLLVLLVIDKQVIKKRLEDSIQYRGPSWVEELTKRGKDRDSSIKWFIGTQKRLQDLYNQSCIPKMLFDTTDSNFSEIANQIVSHLHY